MSITSTKIQGITLVVVSVPKIHAFQVEVVCWKKDVLNLTVNPQVSTHTDFTNIITSLLDKPIKAVFVIVKFLHFSLILPSRNWCFCSTVRLH